MVYVIYDFWVEKNVFSMFLDKIEFFIDNVFFIIFFCSFYLNCVLEIC